jgi:outer membrane protein assembly factor BamC
MNKVFCALSMMALTLSGCSLNPFGNKDAVDYRSAGKGPQLDIPPDLTTPRYDERFRATAGTTAAAAGANAAPGVGTSNVLPKIDGFKLERLGNERWLVVNQTPEALWPTIRAFWQESGFVLTTDRPEIGVLETDWLENRAAIKEDFIRNIIGKVLDGLYSSGTRDRYRVRLERGANNSTEIYVSHRGLEEVPVGSIQQGAAAGFVWKTRASDPNLEAEMLNRMLVRIGLPAQQAQQVAAQAKAAPLKTAATTPGIPSLPARAALAGSTLTVEDPFDRAWRRVGLALDRVGFTVVDRDRTQGTYYVRYADERVKREEGVIEKLKFWKPDDGPQAEQYRVMVKETEGKSNVVVQDKDGAAPQKVVGDRILGLLLEQLK